MYYRDKKKKFYKNLFGIIKKFESRSVRNMKRKEKAKMKKMTRWYGKEEEWSEERLLGAWQQNIFISDSEE